MIRTSCLLFFDPNNVQRKGSALLFPDNLNKLPALQEAFKECGIEDVQEISSQDVMGLEAVEIDIDADGGQIYIFCQKSNMDILRSLFEKKIEEIQVCCSSFNRSKDVIISESSINPLRKLLIHQPDIPFMDSTGGTLLHFAAERGQDILFDALLDCGADINKKKTDGSTALHSAVSVIHQHNVSFAQKIIAKGGDVNAVTADGKTPLHIAAQLGEKGETVVKFLLEFHAGVHSTDLNGTTPLIYAYRNLKSMEFLLIKGALLDAENSRGRTVLLEAVTHLCFESAEYILSLQPNPGVHGNQKAFYTALCRYSNEKDAKLVDLMLQRGFAVSSDDLDKPDVLFGAIHKGLVVAVQSLLDMGVAVNQQHKVLGTVTTPLHFSVEMNREIIVRLLIEHGADVNARVRRFLHNTPLGLAVQKANLEIVKLLFEAGANDQTDSKLLYDALRDPRLDVLEFLLESGLDPSLRNGIGGTCLAILTEKCTVKVIDCLMKFGANCRYADLRKNGSHHRRKTVMQVLLGFCPLKISDYDVEKMYITSGMNKAIKCHIIKLEMLNPKNVSGISMDRIKSKLGVFVQNCQAEAKKLEEYIGDTRLKYRDILTCEGATWFVKNPSVVAAMKGKEIQSRFPIYSNMLTCKFQLAVLRRSLGDQVIPIMRTLLSQFLPSHLLGQPALADELLEIIISYLRIRDLVVLQKFLFVKRSSICSS